VKPVPPLPFKRFKLPFLLSPVELLSLYCPYTVYCARLVLTLRPGVQMSASKSATNKFASILRQDVYPEVGDDVTSDSQLRAAGGRLMGRSFMGVYASDTIPKFPRSGLSLCIVNIDNHTQKGTHWMGLAKSGHRVYLYDSFGRPVEKTLPGLADQCRQQGLTLDSKKSRPEQVPSQNDCGARSLAWLLLFKRCGARTAKLVSE
jgi:hypothetical protein